jgi:hypothetical protein
MIFEHSQHSINPHECHEGAHINTHNTHTPLGVSVVSVEGMF